jgi:hypothetical protein
MSGAQGQPAQPGEAPIAARPPQRLQLFRGPKFDLQKTSRNINGLAAVRIDRNSGWENPFLDAFSQPTAAVAMFRRWLLGEMPPEELAGYSGKGRFSNGTWLANRRRFLLEEMPALRGKNLACWCRPRDPCHGDVLLEVANACTSQERAGGDQEFSANTFPAR